MARTLTENWQLSSHLQLLYKSNLSIFVIDINQGRPRGVVV